MPPAKVVLLLDSDASAARELTSVDLFILDAVRIIPPMLWRATSHNHGRRTIGEFLKE
jgi:hypothetical protein